MLTSSEWQIGRPAAHEYHAYYASYVARVPEGDILDHLEQQGARLSAYFSSISESRGDHRYAEGKWSVKEVIGHLNDTERVMSYRALRFARADTTPLPAFDEQRYVPASGAGERKLRALSEEFLAIRRSSMALLRSLPREAWTRKGVASDAELSVRALAYIIAGHAEHHARLLEERYLI